MKIKRIAALAAVSLVFFVSPLQANINIHVTGAARAGVDQCNQFTGPWNGEGTIETVCKYSGTANVVKDSTPGHYKINVEVQHDTGYFWCPDPGPFTLTAICSNSSISIITSEGTHVTGTTDGRTASLSGEIAMSASSKVTLNSLVLTKV